MLHTRLCCLHASFVSDDHVMTNIECATVIKISIHCYILRILQMDYFILFLIYQLHLHQHLQKIFHFHYALTMHLIHLLQLSFSLMLYV